MSERKDGGPAFPNPDLMKSGMSLRDYFAAAALPLVELTWDETLRHDGTTTGQHVATIAYAIADRMLAWRDK